MGRGKGRWGGKGEMGRGRGGKKGGRGRDPLKKLATGLTTPQLLS